MEPLIRFHKVNFSYETSGEAPEAQTLVLDGLTLRVPPGEFLAVLGHNGSGKSTFAKLCNAILLPTEGNVTVAEHNTKDEEHLLTVRQLVGMVFQNPDNQIVASVVEEDVAFAPENLGVPPAEIRMRVDEALRAVGMYEYREHAPHRLSGGQKQRVAIAGILAMRPSCVVLDEPTAMLDPQGRREVLQTVWELCKSRGVTVILITHHMHEAILADRVVVLDHGGVLLDGSPPEVFREIDLLLRVGLSVPQPAALIHELRLAGESFPETPLDAEHCAEMLYAWLTNNGQLTIDN